jgi:hypothetical protein
MGGFARTPYPENGEHSVMQHPIKLALFAAAACIVGTNATTVSAAPLRISHHHHRASRFQRGAKSGIAANESVSSYLQHNTDPTFNGYFRPAGASRSSYQGPDGRYDSEADFVRDINGTPCGLQCTLEAQKRWSQPAAQ